MSQEADSPYVLFADDSPDMRELVQAALKTRSYCVDTAESAEEMLQMISKKCAGEGRCYDIVITDLRFRTGVDGLSALREIRKAFPNLPVIVLSGLLEPLTEGEAKRLGAGTIEKPIQVDAFMERIEHTLSLTQKHYIGPERRRRSFPPQECGSRRRASDTGELKIPEVLKEAHREATARAATHRKAS
jgi:DNA-binding response OmpR family regulator